jgi:undecaprenyl-diphosphatase
MPHQVTIGNSAVDIVLFMKSALMGIVEGLTEFLPISSTGHLILADSLLEFARSAGSEKAKVFEIAIQTGAIFAVILVYMQRIKDTISGLTSDPKAQRFTLNVIVGLAR